MNDIDAKLKIRARAAAIECDQCRRAYLEGGVSNPVTDSGASPGHDARLPAESGAAPHPQPGELLNAAIESAIESAGIDAVEVVANWAEANRPAIERVLGSVTLGAIAEIRALHTPVEIERYNYETGEMETRTGCAECCKPMTSRRAECNSKHVHDGEPCPTAAILDRWGLL